MNQRESERGKNNVESRWKRVEQSFNGRAEL